MNPSKSQREAYYWKLVALCLENFHHLKAPEAEKSVGDYRSLMAKVMTDVNLLYHEEPFYLACEISNEELKLAEHRKTYDELVSLATTA